MPGSPDGLPVLLSRSVTSLPADSHAVSALWLWKFAVPCLDGRPSAGDRPDQGTGALDPGDGEQRHDQLGGFGEHTGGRVVQHATATCRKKATRLWAFMECAEADVADTRRCV